MSKSKGKQREPDYPEEDYSEEESSEEELPRKRDGNKHSREKSKNSKFEEQLAKLRDSNEDDEEELPEKVTDTSVKRGRAAASPELVLATFEEILTSISDRCRDTSESKSSIAFLKNLHKQLKSLRTQTKYSMKKPRKTNTDKEPRTNSGFQKPIKISRELAKFTGWDENELYSRTDVTKFICNYIKENNLKNPTPGMGKQIIPDTKLKKLLGYNEKTDPELTYFNMQTFLKRQNHFPKD